MIKYDTAFLPSKPFHPSLIFVNKGMSLVLMLSVSSAGCCFSIDRYAERFFRSIIVLNVVFVSVVMLIVVAPHCVL